LKSRWEQSGDVSVYASYTVVEVGVVTHAGEVYSAAQWAAKFADVNSPDTLYDSSALDSSQCYKSSFDRGNLIEFVYFKVSDERTFAIRCSYTDLNNALIGSAHFQSQNLLLMPNAANYQNSLADIVYFADGVNFDAGKIPSSYFNYSVGITPADLNVLVDEKYGDGELYTQILEDKLASMGHTSDLIANLRLQADPFGLGKTMYLASLYEILIVIQNADKFLSVFDTINDVFVANWIWANIAYTKILCGYFAAPVRDSYDVSFSTIHEVVYGFSQTTTPQSLYASNLQYRYETSQRMYEAMRYCQVSGVEYVDRGGIWVNSLFLMSFQLSDLI